jgi:hypothetical protein
LGASIKAYRPVGSRLEEVGRLTPVEVRKGRVTVAWGGVGVEVEGTPVCKADLAIPAWYATALA